MASETLTTLDRILKEYYPAGGIVNQVNVDTFLLDKVEMAKRFQNVGGRYFYKPARFGLSGGSGPRGEDVALPTPNTVTFDDIQIPIRFHYGVIQVTGPAMALSKGDKNAFAEALSLTMDGMYEEFRLVASIMLYGWGSGIIGVVSSVAASVITLADDINNPMWFYEGQVIDSYQSNESTVRQAGMRITNINLGLREITVDTIGATAATDRLVLASGLNKAFHGLLAAVDDSAYVDTYFGIQRTAAGRSKWKSYVNHAGTGTSTKYGAAAASRRSVSGDLIQKALDEQRKRAGSARAVDQFVSSLGTRRAYWNSLSPDRKFDTLVYDGGWEQLKFSNGDRVIPWFADELAPKFTIFGLHMGTKPAGAGKRVDKVQDEEVLALYQGLAPDWDAVTGSELKQVYSGAAFVDAVGAYLKWYANFGTCRPNIHVRIDDILGD